VNVLTVGLVGGWTVIVDANVTVYELRQVNVTCSTDYTESTVTFKWTSRSHPGFEQTGRRLLIDRATADVAGNYECTVKTESTSIEKKWAQMYLNVICKYR